MNNDFGLVKTTDNSHLTLTLGADALRQVVQEYDPIIIRNGIIREKEMSY